MSKPSDLARSIGLGTAISVAFALGFRPFYLAAGLFAVVAVPIWVTAYAGQAALDGYLSGAAWHSHEMLFGFAPAVIAGFLLTATRQWTGRSTATGMALAGLVALWVAGRVLVFTGPSTIAPVVDGSFLPMLALAVGIPIWKSRNRRNLFVVGILATLALTNVLFHLDQAGLVGSGIGGSAIRLALNLLAILMAVMGGRIIPAFTANAIPSAKPRRLAVVEAASIGLLVFVLVADLLAPRWPIGSPWLPAILIVAAAAHGLRLALWSPLATRPQPLLWCLPLSYGWIPVALVLRAAALFSPDIDPLLATHALAIGAMGGLMLSMMTRSALGHTGRPLVAGWAEISAFVLIQAAVLFRIVPDLIWPAAHLTAVGLSSACWSAAFLVFVIRYAPILTRPRVDGRPG